MPSTLPVLSNEAIAALAIPPSRLRQALAEAFRLHAAGEPQVNPKQMLPIEPGHFFQSLSAASATMGFAAHKWVGVVAANGGRGLPTVNSLVTLSDFATGVPAAILGGNAVTVLRTAAMSGLAASHLARPDSRTIGFVGCGQQAHGHLDALADVLPGLSEAVCISANGRSAETLADTARSRGLQARAVRDPNDALACDVVVTSVQAGPGAAPFLDATRLRPGTFVAAVDLGAPWHPETLRVFDIAATDDRAQAETPSTRARLAFQDPFGVDLADLCAGRHPGRTAPEQRALFLFPGFALADLAVAAAIWRAARQA